MTLAGNNLPKIQFIKQPDNFGCCIIGEVYQQLVPFQWYECDWNNDGDVYEEKVAKFQKISDMNLHSPNYLCLIQREFLELKNEGYIAYVKEQKKYFPPPLTDVITRASARMKRQGREAMEELDKQISFSNQER